MKTLYKRTFLLIALFMSVISFSQQKQLDTLNYIKQFETNKASYIGKPFSYLLSKLTVQTQPKKVWFLPNPNNKNIVLTTTFSLNKKEDNIGNAVRLDITWQEPIPFVNVDYYYKKNKTFFTEEEKNFYGTKIIKDIEVY